jgi:hypothetical protein
MFEPMVPHRVEELQARGAGWRGGRQAHPGEAIAEFLRRAEAVYQ